MFMDRTCEQDFLPYGVRQCVAFLFVCLSCVQGLCLKGGGRLWRVVRLVTGVEPSVTCFTDGGIGGWEVCHVVFFEQFMSGCERCRRYTLWQCSRLAYTLTHMPRTPTSVCAEVS